MFLQTISSPLKIIIPAVNIVLVLIIAALVTLGTRMWVVPKYHDKVDVDRVTYVPKNLEPLALIRKNNNDNIINAAVQSNLFRKDRREYSPPVQIAKLIHKPAPPVLPPPNLRLKGVLLLGTKKIAIMEGDYPVREGRQPIRKKTLKRRGYQLGAKIGDFELTQIEKTNVTLVDNRGAVLNLNLAQRPQDKIIRKVGNALVQKNKIFDPAKIKKATPPRRTPPAALQQPQPVRSQDQARPSAGMWTRFKREEDPAEQK
jgi:hypothetical protein